MGKQSEAIGASLRAQVELRAKALVLAFADELKKNPRRGGTPRDTGHASANWVPSITSPHSGEVDGDGAYEAGVAQVLAYHLADGALWVANGVPYIRFLNYGSSKQAPALFVEACIDRALARIEKQFASRGGGITQSSFRQEIGSIGAENMAGAYNPLGGDE